MGLTLRVVALSGEGQRGGVGVAANPLRKSPLSPIPLLPERLLLLTDSLLTTH